ncbi:hypothetical protein X739_00600 [Mesorhizobium sp. LNHC220B00]|nr:hypothetical protein X739_00600 [Mesorhizobium sp. LNHC220B00]
MWKPIATLTEAEFDDAHMHHRLMVWNSCNGPHHVSTVHDPYFAAWQIQAEGVWEKYLVLPDAA